MQQFAFLEIEADVPDDAIVWAERALSEGMVDVVQRLTAAAELAAGLNARVVGHVAAPPPAPFESQGPNPADTWGSATPARPAAPQAPVAAAGRSCAHGARTNRTGTGQRGPWSGWFCPTPKGTPGQCPPEWD